ncbi:conserved hypothetical protein [Uncinocarpus reesii 1704]|uniref:t-SNARE coiled-coil homology domain-containing protein n=1 Tax=Uncinocarpus reesii (strain UAMH 1704) TaxID=336963 RepID=C4JQ62_UNCRE|nr:uncharacterized protein UREG_03295 [Uncinocarpus reesii 1704]EEP78449.1 conserved hypothetical protein [Uncinocarpus reesii 1704]
MWRDRTNLYISYRQSFSHHPAKKPRYIGSSWNDDNSEERRGLISGAGAGFEDDGDAVIEMDLLPPRWLDVQDEVTELLRDIAHKSSQLDRLHQKHVLPSFGDEDVRREEEGVIERLTQEITRAFHSCQRNIQKIETMVRDARQAGTVSRGEETMAKNLQISMAAKVQEASASFRKKQSTYLKSTCLLQFPILEPSDFANVFASELRGLDGLSSPLDRSPTPILQQQNPYIDPSLLESDADKSYSQSTLLQTSQHQQQQRQLGRSNDAVILQREREINDIAKGIIELSDIFRDLQTMIIDQGTMLDRIDYNVERMTVDVKAADRELTVATGYQKRTTKRKILLLLLLLVVGMFILLLVKPKRHNSAPQPPPSSNPPPAIVQEIEVRPPDRGPRQGRRGRRKKPSLGLETRSADDAVNDFSHDIWRDPLSRKM